jgi:hypothetical protein
MGETVSETSTSVQSLRRRVDGLPSQHPPHHPQVVSLPLGGHQQGEGLAHHLLPRVAVQPLRAAVPGGDVPLEVGAQDGVVGGLDDGGEPAAHLVVVAAGAHVGEHGQRALEAALGVHQRVGPDERPQLAAILAEVAALVGLGQPLLAPLELLVVGLAIRGIEQVVDRAAEQLLAGVAEHLGAARVDEVQAHVAVDGHHPLVGGLDDAPVALLAHTQRLLGLLQQEVLFTHGRACPSAPLRLP